MSRNRIVARARVRGHRQIPAIQEPPADQLRIAAAVRGVDDPFERVEEQLGAEPLTMEGLVERESTDEVTRQVGVVAAERSGVRSAQRGCGAP